MNRNDLDKIKFKNYCWSIGTTSFRMKNFNYNIEQQLIYLKEFFDIEDNKNLEWNSDTQEKYYYFLKEKGFVKGDANRPDKDARQKTSGLHDLGLVNEDRRITDAGQALIDISVNNDFKGDNYFRIDKDSYIYLCQLLKLEVNENKPFLNFLKIVNSLDYLTEEEFTYLLPLTVDEVSTSIVLDSIKLSRQYNTSIDSVLMHFIKGMENYKFGLQYFIENEPSEELFGFINVNRKSASYDEIYYYVYKDFYDVYVNGDESRIVSLFDNISKIKNKPSTLWKKLLFNTPIRNKVVNNPKSCLNGIEINCNSTEMEVKEYFYYKTHLFKWKSTLSDYYDLNRRYFKTTDIAIFKDSKVYLSTIAKEYFKLCIDDYYVNYKEIKTNLYDNNSIEDILGKHTPDIETVYTEIAAELDQEYIDPDEVDNYINNQRINEFNELIDTKFTNSNLIKYLGYFEERNDEALFDEITDGADAPTLFEYILAICWYKLSNKEGNILDYMNLSLDTNMLPKQHAGGGEADILYSYKETKYYPKHNLVLEATLADSSVQRRMEMEPVSRHLMRDLEETGNLNDYAILVSTYIHPSIVGDFRGKAKTEQSLDYVHIFNGIKILPLSTKEVRSALLKNTKYQEIYKLLDNAYKSNIGLAEWYKKEIEDKFK